MRLPDALALVMALAAGARATPTLTIRFVPVGDGSVGEQGDLVGAVQASNLSTGIVCGEYTGPPTCALNENPCCAIPIPPDLRNQTVTLEATALRTPASGGQVYFVRWGGGCVQLPYPCDPNDPAFTPVCVGGQDLRGKVVRGNVNRKDPFAAYGCDVLLPILEDENKEVTLSWRIADPIALGPCSFTETCGTGGTTTTSVGGSSTTSTTLPRKACRASCRRQARACLPPRLREGGGRADVPPEMQGAPQGVRAVDRLHAAALTAASALTVKPLRDPRFVVR